MPKTADNFFEKYFYKLVPADGLAVFRVFYSMVLLYEVGTIYYFRHLIFDTPFGQFSFWTPALICWMIILLMLLIGLAARYAAIGNYCFTLLTFGTFKAFEYHMDYSYIGVNFLLMFVPVSKTFSFDNLIQKLRSPLFEQNPNTWVRVINYHIILLLGIGLIYFDSVFHKASSSIWRNGLGVWLPSSVPQIVINDLSPFLNLKYIMLFLSHLTLVFEAVFIFLFWVKPFRLPLFIIGIGLHFGILITFPIPIFALGFMALYLLMVPFSYWRKLGAIIRSREPKLTVIYDDTKLRCNKLRVLLNHFDLFNTVEFRPRGIHELSDGNLESPFFCYYREQVFFKEKAVLHILKTIPFTLPLGYLFSLPGLKSIFRNRVSSIWQSSYTPQPIRISNKKKSFVINPSVKRAIIKLFILVVVLLQLMYVISITFVKHHLPGFIKDPFVVAYKEIGRQYPRLFLGLGPHTVFLDFHFKGYNHIVALAYLEDGKEKFLPLISESGMSTGYNTGRVFANWTFRIVGPEIHEDLFIEGVKRYTAFWAYKNNISLSNADFNIKVKKIDLPQNWEKDFLKKQLAKPWRDAGIAKWKNNQFSADIKNIEAM